jgi:hypothetical protein
MLRATPDVRYISLSELGKALDGIPNLKTSDVGRPALGTWIAPLGGQVGPGLVVVLGQEVVELALESLTMTG